MASRCFLAGQWVGETGPFGSVPYGDEPVRQGLADPTREAKERKPEPSSDDGSGFRYDEGVGAEGLPVEID